ncbi:MAG: hypothetical protein ACRESX_09790, partial [Gammaproteobacteria bacterium]
MKAQHILFATIATLAISSAAVASNRPLGVNKLGARLSVVAVAAAENRTEPLMSQALTREIFRRNPPLAVRWNAAGQVQVYLHYERFGAPPEINTLAALGATGILISNQLAVVQAWVPANHLYDIAALPEVTRMTTPRYAVVKRASQVSPLPRTGSVDSQGDQILNAQLYRTLTGYNGSGIAVGVISDGDDHISSSQSTGDLP